MMNESLTSPLISSGDKISSWMHAQINKESGSLQDGTRERVRNVAKATLAVVVISGNLVFIPLNPEFFPGSREICAFGNVIAGSAIDYWAGRGFIDDTLPSGTGLENVFSKRELSMRYAALTSINVFISFLVQLPAIYPSMQYNKGSLSILCGVLAGARGIAIPMRSIQLSIAKFFDLTAAKKLGLNPEKQQRFVQLLQENRQRFINMDKEAQERFIAELSVIRKQVDSQEKIDAYWNHLIPVTTLTPSKPLSGLSYGSTQVAKGTGLALTIIYLYVIGRYTFEKTKEDIWDNDVFAGVTATLVDASECYLMQLAVINSAEKLFHIVTGINKNIYAAQESLADKFRKRPMIGLQIAGALCDVLALGVTYTIWQDFFKDKTERAFFEVTMCSAIFLLFYGPLSQVITDCAEQTLLYAGTPHEKAAIRLSREYQGLAESVGKISPKDFEEFSAYLPSSIIATLGASGSIQDETSGYSLHSVTGDKIPLLKKDIESIGTDDS